MVELVRWSKSERTLPGGEVDAEFAAHPDIIHLFAFTTDRMHVGEHSGSLSVKIVTHGREAYRFGSRRVDLRAGEVLVVNAGQTYESSIDEPGTRSISFFLPPEVAAMAARATRSFDDRRTGHPGGEAPQIPFRPGPRLHRTIDRLSAAVSRPGRPDPVELEELLLRAAAESWREAAGLLPPHVLGDRVRRSTREELVTRVLRARDLVRDTHGRATLAQMADAAGLSRYHFLRAFEGLFGVTPGRFARGVRLERGRASLERGDPPAVAARKAGYGSTGAFLRALRRAADSAGAGREADSQLLHRRRS